MEFTFKVTEAEYIQAAKLRMRAPRSRIIKLVLFWVFVLVCLVLLWLVVQKNASSTQDQTATTQSEAADSGTKDATEGRPDKTRTLLVNTGPFLVLMALWLFLLSRFSPMRLRRLYRKDPMMQGQFTVKIAPDSFDSANTSGSSSRSAWNVYEYWREGKNVIILVNFTGTYFLLGLTDLPELRRTELRGILAAALPQK